jgi:hypothetical protein
MRSIALLCLSLLCTTASASEFIWGTWQFEKFMLIGIYSGGSQIRATEIIRKGIEINNWGEAGIILPDGTVCRLVNIHNVDLPTLEENHYFGSAGGSFSEIGIHEPEAMVVTTNCLAQSQAKNSEDHLWLDEIWITNEGYNVFMTWEGQYIRIVRVWPMDC